MSDSFSRTILYLIVYIYPNVTKLLYQTMFPFPFFFFASLANSAKKKNFSASALAHLKLISKKETKNNKQIN